MTSKKRKQYLCIDDVSLTKYAVGKIRKTINEPDVNQSNISTNKSVIFG